MLQSRYRANICENPDLLKAPGSVAHYLRNDIARCSGMHAVHFKDARQAIAEIEAALSL